MANVTFKFNPSNEPDLTDDEYLVLVDGKETTITIQVSGRSYCVNEHSPEEVENFWMREHLITRQLTKAKEKAAELALALVAKEVTA